MTITEEILNKLAYADGEKAVNDDGLTVYDHGKPYNFGLRDSAYALGVGPNENPVLGVASRVLGFHAEEENKYNTF